MQAKPRSSATVSCTQGQAEGTPIMVGRDRRGGRESARINTGEASEVEYWTKAFGISQERLAEIIAKVGDRVDAVRAEIADARKRDQEK